MMHHLKVFSVIFIVVFKSFYVIGEEPRCSKYDFEEKVLEKLVRMEHQVELLKQDYIKSTGELKEIKSNMEQYIETMDKTLATIIETVDITNVEVMVNKTLHKEVEDLNVFKDKHSPPTIMFKSRTLAKTSYNAGETFVFTNVFSEHGDGYNPDNGAFTVPVTGMYWFQVTLCSSSGGCVVGILVDGKNILVEYLYNIRGRPCFSYSTIHHLSVGQSVEAKALLGDTCDIDQSDNHRWNTFYGLLLHG